MTTKNTFKEVKIEANSRLHLGFISLNSSTPFTYGGVGISISGQPTIVNIKNSKMGYIILCSLAPVFLTIPIGTFVVLKFYGNRKLTYWLVFISLASISFILTFINHFIFN